MRETDKMKELKGEIKREEEREREKTSRGQIKDRMNCVKHCLVRYGYICFIGGHFPCHYMKMQNRKFLRVSVTGISCCTLVAFRLVTE